MKIELEMILLVVVVYFVGRELYQVSKWMAKKDFILWDRGHSIEHFVYLMWYQVSIMLQMIHLITWDEVFAVYAIIMFSLASWFLIDHIGKERLIKY